MILPGRNRGCSRTPFSAASLLLLLGACLEIGFFTADCSAEGMQYPLAIAAAPDGTLYVADRNLPGIWKVQEGKASLFFEGSKKFRTPLNAVRCLAVSKDGKLYAGDSATREVYLFDAQGKPQPLTGGGIGIPTAIAIDSKGDLLVADLELHCIFQVASAGGKATEFVKVQAPRGIAIDAQDRLWVLSHSKQPLLRFGADKKSEVVIGEPIFQFSHHLVLDSEGNGFVADGYAKTIWKIPPQGKPESFFSGEPLKNPVGITIAKDRLMVVDPHQKAVYSIPLVGEKVLQTIVK